MARRALAGALPRGLRNGLPICKAQAPMPTVHLDDRALIVRRGRRRRELPAEHRHHRPRRAGDGEARPGALLSPQGKILFDFLVSRAGESGFRLECRAALADDFVRRLMLYKLRAKATIAKQDQALVAVSWGSEIQALHKLNQLRSQTDSTRFATAASSTGRCCATTPRSPRPTRPKPNGRRCASPTALPKAAPDYAAGRCLPA